MVAITHCNAHVDGTDIRAAFLNVNALHAGIGGGYLSGNFRHDAFAAFHTLMQHGLKFVLYIGSPARRRYLMRGAAAHLI